MAKGLQVVVPAVINLLPAAGSCVEVLVWVLFPVG